MRIVKDGYYYLTAGVLLGVIAWRLLHPAAGLFLILLGVALCLFFRDPERKIPSQKNAVVAVADGTIMGIDEKEEPEFLKGHTVRIVTFLSPLNVHVNRAPVEGTVTYLKHVHGPYAPAFKEHSEKNERQYIGIAGKTNALVVMMVGSLARRIENWTSLEQRLPKGAKIGIMKFGSRADLYLPKRSVAKILVKKGDKVKAGETIVALLK